MLPAILTMLVPGLSQASPDGLWSKLQPNGLLGHTAIVDTIGDRILVFGGLDQAHVQTPDVWALPLAGGEWQRLDASGAVPPLRNGHTAVYDSKHRRMVIFGGGANDLWTLTLSGTPTWYQVATTGTPPPSLVGHDSIYDPVRDRMLIFGGNDGSLHNEVWALSLSGTPTWSQLATAGSPPSAREGAMAVYDPVRDRWLIVGGHTGSDFSSGYLNDVWALSLSGTPTWSAVSVGGSTPSPRAWGSAIYDPVGDRMVLEAGMRPSPVFGFIFPDTTWFLSLPGSPTWSAVPGSHGERGDTFVYDAARHQAIAFGGYHWSCENCYPGDFQYDAVPRVLALDGTPTWSSRAISLVPAEIAYGLKLHRLVYDSARDRALVVGGSFSSNLSGYIRRLYAYSFASGQWSAEDIGGEDPGGFAYHAAVYDPVGNAAVVVGGDSTTLNSHGPWHTEVWKLSLSGSPQWTHLHPAGPAPTASALVTHAVLDPLGHRLIVLIESGAISDSVWSLSLDGAGAWTPLHPGGPDPGARVDQSVAYDSPRHRMILTGGLALTGPTPVHHDTWALSLDDTTTWSLLLPEAQGPSFAGGDCMVYDTMRDRMVRFGGDGSGAPTSASHGLTLGVSPAWTTLAPPEWVPPPCDDARGFYDPVRDQFVQFGALPTSSLEQAPLDQLYALRFTDALTPTAASLVSATAIPGGVRLVWQTAEAGTVVFTIERKIDSGGWLALATGIASASDLVSYDDTSLTPGQHASYRLAWTDADGAHTTLATDWTEPLAAAPGLGAPWPNPVQDALTVRFALATSAPARLELYDVAGRRVRTASVSAAAGVAATARLDGLGTLPPGIYQLRLVQAGKAFNRRVTLMR